MPADHDLPPESARPHDGAQSQADDGVGGTPAADGRERRAGDPDPEPSSPQVAALPPVPVAGEPSASSAPGRSTSPPGTSHAGPRQPSVAAPGRPDGEVDTRR